MDTIDAQPTFIPWYAGMPLEVETALSLKELRIRRLAARKLRVARIRANINASPSRPMFDDAEQAA